MDLLRHLRMSHLNFNFVMIYIVHKILVLHRYGLNYFKDLLTLFRMGWDNFTSPVAFFLLWKIEVGLWPAAIFQWTKFTFTCFLNIWAHFDPSIKSSQSFVIASWHVIFQINKYEKNLVVKVTIVCSHCFVPSVFIPCYR